MFERFFGESLLVKNAGDIFIKNLLHKQQRLSTGKSFAGSCEPRSKFGARLPAEGRGKGELWLGTSARLIGVRVRWSEFF
jgi:hypothetical protein